MTVHGQQIIRLEFTSAFEMLDFVQIVSDHVCAPLVWTTTRCTG